MCIELQPRVWQVLNNIHVYSQNIESWRTSPKSQGNWDTGTAFIFISIINVLLLRYDNYHDNFMEMMKDKTIQKEEGRPSHHHVE